MEFLQIVRDVAIIILALETIVIGAALLVLVLQTWKLVGQARHYLDVVSTSTTTILGTVQETARETRGTASFVGDRTARPVIELYSAAAGVNRFVRAVLRLRPSPPAEATTPDPGQGAGS